jgi:hypothetical protein
MFFKRNHIWESDEMEIHNCILSHILNSNIKKAGKKEDVSYAQNVKSAEAIRKAVLSLLRLNSSADDEFYDKLHTTTKGRLCFKDGVLDLPTKKFYLWDDVDFEYYSTLMIPIDFAEQFKNPNSALCDEIIQSVFEPLFADKIPTVLHFLSRAIAGHSEDKNWSSYLGNRDCGKGVIFGLLKGAFGDYVRSFDISKVMYERNRQDISEVSRKQYWLIDFEFTRLGISQETPDRNSKMLINSKMWKAMCGGGDTLVARRNYDRVDTYFNIDTTFMAFGNDVLNFDTNDVYEHGVQFSSCVKFRSQEEIEHVRANCIDPLEWANLRVADPLIKSKCATHEWRMAIIHILINAYRNDPVCVEEEVDDEDEVPLRRRILELYQITKVGTDVLPVSMVVDELGYAKKKVMTEMAGLGVSKKQCKSTRSDHFNKWCFFGLKTRGPPSVETDTEDMDG